MLGKSLDLVPCKIIPFPKRMDRSQFFDPNVEIPSNIQPSEEEFLELEPPFTDEEVLTGLERDINSISNISTFVDKGET